MGIVSNIPAASNTAPSVFDDRLVEVDIVFPDQTLTFNNLAIFAQGTISLTAMSNDCRILIYNLTQQQRQQLLTQTSPYYQPGQFRKPAGLFLKAGRKSYGTFLLFAGNVIASTITQPPDIGIEFNALTGNSFNGQIINWQEPANTRLHDIAQNVANRFNPQLTLQYHVANERQINNFSGQGSPNEQVSQLNQIGGIKATIINDNTLLVMDAGGSVNNDPIVIDESSGMVGIPQTTADGIMVKVMLSNLIGLGAKVQIKSAMNPVANGVYNVNNIKFDIANRDTPFWYTLLCSNSPYIGTTTS